MEECVSWEGTMRAKARGWDLSEEVRLAGMGADECINYYYYSFWVNKINTGDSVSVGH